MLAAVDRFRRAGDRLIVDLRRGTAPIGAPALPPAPVFVFPEAAARLYPPPLPAIPHNAAPAPPVASRPPIDDPRQRIVVPAPIATPPAAPSMVPPPPLTGWQRITDGVRRNLRSWLWTR